MIDYLEKDRKIAILFVFLTAVEIFAISSIPGNNLTTGGIDFSSLYHGIIFFLLTFFLLISIAGKKKIKVKYLIFAMLFSILYAISDEIHQFFVPFRYPSMSDILIDLTGILLSVVVYMYYKRNSKTKK